MSEISKTPSPPTESYSAAVMVRVVLIPDNGPAHLADGSQELRAWPMEVPAGMTVGELAGKLCKAAAAAVRGEAEEIAGVEPEEGGGDGEAIKARIERDYVRASD